MRTTVGWVVILTLGIVTTSCTGDDDPPGADATTAPTGSAVDATEPTDEPATTEAPTITTAPTTTLPPPPVAVRVGFEGFPDAIDTSSASQLLPAQPGRGHVLVGMTRVAGSPAVPAVWSSPDGINWDAAPAPASPAGGTAHVFAAAYTADGLALGGSQVSGDGVRRAALWVAADGRTFAAPAEPPAGDRPSAIEALADSAAGLVAAGWVENGGVRSVLVAVRAGGGAWTEATVPPLPGFNVWDVATAGPTVVIVGNDSSVTPRQAMALVSTDGGATFSVADTAAFAGATATNIGAVDVTPSGFLAVACAPTPTGTVTALAHSVDGLAWTRQDIALPSDEIGLDNAQCDSLAVEGDVAYIGNALARAWVVTVQPDGQATATRVPQRPEQAASESPLIAALGGGQLVAISRDDGGFSGATLPAAVTAVGLPFGAPSIGALDASTTTAGIAVRVQLSPEYTRTANTEQWGPYSRWFSSNDGAAITFDPNTPEALQLATAAPFGDVGIGSVDGDPEDEAAVYRGAVEGFVRAPGGAWESVGLVVTGPASEGLLALAVTSSGTVVGVGYALTYDDASGQVPQPVVRSTTDGRTWVPETITGAVPPDAALRSVCPRPDGTVVAFGTQSDGVTNRAFGVLRATDGTWTVIPSVNAETDAVACAVTATGRTILRLAGPAGPSLLLSDDGANFGPADTTSIAFDDDDIAEIVAVDGGLVGVGTARGQADFDPIVITSNDDGATWEVAHVLGMTGLGDQRAYGVAVTGNGGLLVVGTDNGAPVGWLIPAGELP